MDRLTISTTFFFLALVNALPIPNYSDRLVWANTPDTRGTLTIVFSCGAALLLCIWSGIHSNVNPNADDDDKKGAKLTIAKVVGKAALASIALLAPDIVLTVALHQLLVALQYQEALNAPEDQPMSFFATMGGFCFSETTIQGFHRRSLAFDTLLHPKTMEIIRKQPLSDIEDKSKASGIAKTVAAFQIFWIILQVIGRYIGRLHITLLELNTCIHVVLAILTYAIWFRKPLDV
ncbi:hypothetical protein FPQ18DRAFT_262954, partial [Pyronema domesticum]